MGVQAAQCSIVLAKVCHFRHVPVLEQSLVVYGALLTVECCELCVCLCECVCACVL